MEYSCHETVTLTIQGTFQDTTYLLDLAKYWDGLVSFAIFAPGSDYNATVEEISYLRHCYDISPRIRAMTSFTFIIPIDHMPDVLLSPTEMNKARPNCSRKYDNAQNAGKLNQAMYKTRGVPRLTGIHSIGSRKLVPPTALLIVQL